MGPTRNLTIAALLISTLTFLACFHILEWMDGVKRIHPAIYNATMAATWLSGLTTAVLGFAYTSIPVWP